MRRKRRCSCRHMAHEVQASVYKLVLSLPRSAIMILFVLLLFSTLAVAAPLDLPLDLGTFRNLTATSRCSDSADWQAYAFLVEDCYAAVQRLYIEDVLRKPDVSYEFISRYGHHGTKRPWIRTPVQISVRESSPLAFHVSCS